MRLFLVPMLASFFSFGNGAMSKLTHAEYDSLMETCGQDDPSNATVHIENLVTKKHCLGVLLSRTHLVTAADCLIGADGAMLDLRSLQQAAGMVTMKISAQCREYENRIEPCNHSIHPLKFVTPIGVLEHKKTKSIVLLDVLILPLIIVPTKSIPCLPTERLVSPENLTVLYRDTKNGTLIRTWSTFNVYRDMCDTCYAVMETKPAAGAPVGPGGMIYHKSGSRFRINGLMTTTPSISLDMSLWRNFICAHTRLCVEGYAHRPNAEDFIEDGRPRIGFEANGYGRHTHDKFCSPGHIEELIHTSTPLTRLTTEQYLVLKKSCGTAVKRDNQQSQAPDGIGQYDWSEHPYLVAVSILTESAFRGYCSGALITPMHVISSLSCLRKRGQQQNNEDVTNQRLNENLHISVQFGSRLTVPASCLTMSGTSEETCKSDLKDAGNETQVVGVEKMAVPFCENPELCEKIYDVVLLQLRNAIPLDSPDARPICLASSTATLPSEGRLLGFDGTLAEKHGSHVSKLTEKVSRSQGNCLDGICNLKLNVDATKPLVAADEALGSPYTYVNNGRQYLMGVLSNFTNVDGTFTSATNVLSLLGFICLHTGNCPDGPLQNVTQPLLVGNIQNFRDDPFMQSRAEITQLVRRVPLNLAALDRRFKTLAETIKELNPRLNITRKIFTKEEYGDIEKKCGKIRPKQRSRVHYGGIFESPGMNPWFAAIFLRVPENVATDMWYPVCAGAFISPFHVLTSRHCVQIPDTFINNQPTDLMVAYGSECFAIATVDKDDVTNTTVGDQFNRTWCHNGGETTQRFAKIRNVISPMDGQEDARIVDMSENVANDFSILELVEKHDGDYLCLPKSKAKYSPNITIVAAGADHSHDFKVGQIQFMRFSEEDSHMVRRKGKTIHYSFIDYQFGLPKVGEGDSGGPWIRQSVDEPDRSVFWAIQARIDKYYAENVTDAEYKNETVDIYGASVESIVPFLCEMTGLCPNAPSTPPMHNTSSIQFNLVKYCVSGSNTKDE